MEMFTVLDMGNTRVQIVPVLVDCSWNQKATGRNRIAAISHVTAVRIVASCGVSRERYGGTTMHRWRSMLMRVSVHSKTKPHTNCTVRKLTLNTVQNILEVFYCRHSSTNYTDKSPSEADGQ